MEANEKLKQEADSHNKTKKINAELAMGAAGREHTLAELQDKVAVLQRNRDALEAEAAALQVKRHFKFLDLISFEYILFWIIGSTWSRKGISSTRSWPPARDGNQTSSFGERAWTNERTPG